MPKIEKDQTKFLITASIAIMMAKVEANVLKACGNGYFILRNRYRQPTLCVIALICCLVPNTIIFMPSFTTKSSGGLMRNFPS